MQALNGSLEEAVIGVSLNLRPATDKRSRRSIGAFIRLYKERLFFSPLPRLKHSSIEERDQNGDAEDANNQYHENRRCEHLVQVRSEEEARTGVAEWLEDKLGNYNEFFKLLNGNDVE